MTYIIQISEPEDLFCYGPFDEADQAVAWLQQQNYVTSLPYKNAPPIHMGFSKQFRDTSYTSDAEIMRLLSPTEVSSG